MVAQLLTDKEVAQLIGVSRSTVWRYLSNSEFPKRFRLSPRITRWRLSDVEHFIASFSSETAALGIQGYSQLVGA